MTDSALLLLLCFWCGNCTAGCMCGGVAGEGYEFLRWGTLSSLVIERRKCGGGGSCCHPRKVRMFCYQYRSVPRRAVCVTSRGFMVCCLRWSAFRGRSAKASFSFSHFRCARPIASIDRKVTISTRHEAISAENVETLQVSSTLTCPTAASSQRTSTKPTSSSQT